MREPVSPTVSHLASGGTHPCVQEPPMSFPSCLRAFVPPCLLLFLLAATPATRPATTHPATTMPARWQDLPQFRDFAAQLQSADAALAAAQQASAKSLAADPELSTLTQAATN